MVTRRQVLQGSGTAIALFGGCSGTSGGDETTTTAPPPSLAFDAAVTAQATPEHPMAVELGITNETDREIQVAPRGRVRPLEDLGRFDGPAELVAVPRSSNVEVDDLASEPADGCWRFRSNDGEPAMRVALSTSFPTTFGAGYQYDVIHDIYQAVDAGPCFPAGTYEASQTLTAGRESNQRSFTVTFSLTIDEDGDGAITTTEE